MTDSVVGSFRKSSYSGSDGDCVEVTPTPQQGAAVRDSKDQRGPVLAFSGEAWAAFVAAVSVEDGFSAH